MSKNKIISDEAKKWYEEGLINETLYNELLSRYAVKGWDISTIIKWALIFGAIMLGIGLISFVSLIFKSLTFVVLILSILCVLSYYWGFQLTSKEYKYYYPKSGNTLITLASLILCGDVFALGKLLSSGGDNWPILILLVAIIYFIIAYLKKNTLVLIFALLSLATWYGTQTGYVSGWGAYYLGLNYPMRFAVVSPLVILIGYLHKKYELNVPESFIKVYYSLGLLYINLSLWVMSIFGNYGNLDYWHDAEHFELLFFSLIWGIASVIIFIIGTKYKNRMFIGYAIVFFILNLYTRYFEYFWDAMHKSLFFIILGGLSIAVGVYFERLLKSRRIAEQDNTKTEDNTLGKPF